MPLRLYFIVLLLYKYGGGIPTELNHAPKRFGGQERKALAAEQK
jgi:hypothetical protein